MVTRYAYRETKDAILHIGPEQDRSDDVGRIDPHQERGRPHLDIPSKLPRGNLRQLRDEH